MRAPDQADTLRKLAKGFIAPSSHGYRRVFSVTGGKGGVGKSTVAANLAIALAQTGATVGLLDGDIYGPNLPRMLGVNRQPRTHEGRIVPLEAHACVERAAAHD